MNEQLRSQVDLLRQIRETLDLSLQAHKAYLEGRKTFGHAKKIRVHNDTLRKLLNDPTTLPPHLHPDAAAVLEHLQTWTAKWDEWKAMLNPRDEDEFAFPNDHVFPKQSATNLTDEYTRLKNELHER